MEEVKIMVSNLFVEFGLNDVTLRASEILDELIVVAQREELRKWREK